jgi:16S rRNA C967 or C1407 C5-methylase (RsmB/RsmF family)/NOL1/NOP2/fmu family ribosome biogenesis protein
MPAAALPEAFEARMRALLGPEAPAFLASYRRPAERAVRANPLKLDPAALPGLLGIEPEPVPWCREAFFLPQGARVGDTLAHAAGLCYVQEPSALAVGEALDVRPGQRVLDLAVQRARVQALADNLDRWGSDRTVLAGETVARLAERLPASFDRVLLDAPCSGEGLFRRNPAAAAQWRPGHVRGSAERQRALLADAARLVRPGGVLVYATCTFAPEENEHQIAGFLAAHPGWRLLDIPRHPGFAPGRPDWSPSPNPDLTKTVRLWPHHLRGEGHFIAKLGSPGDPGAMRVAGPPVDASPPHPPVDALHPDPPVDVPHLHPPVDALHPDPPGYGAPTGRVAHRAEGGVRVSTAPLARAGQGASGDQRRRGGQGRRDHGRGGRGAGDQAGRASESAVLEAWEEFAGEALEGWPAEVVTVVGERVYRVADEEVVGAGARLVRPGLLLGRVRPGRFEPAHALGMVAGPVAARRVRRLDGAEAAGWLRGEALAHDGPGGWTLVTWEGWSLGWGRAAGGTLKNHYPKGLRTM